jgi:HlyD family secretion protein
MSTSQEATKFEVRIRLKEKENFLPGMSVTAEIETRYRTNALAVPIAAVTTRMPKPEAEQKGGDANSGTNAPDTSAKPDKKAPKAIEVVFVVEDDHVKQTPVKIGIADDNYWEITEGLEEGQEIVTGGYKAISRELEDGKKIRKGVSPAEDKEKK